MSIATPKAARGTGCSDEIGREGYPKGRGAAGGSESEASRARFRRSRMEEVASGFNVSCSTISRLKPVDATG